MSQPSEDRPEGAPRATRATLGRRTQILLAVLVVALAVVVFWPRGTRSEAAPEGLLVDAAGHPVPMGSRMAPVTLVHFWATWCPPCRTEAPSIGRLADDFSRYRGTFTVLMVSVADDAGKARSFAGARAGSVLYDPSWDVAHRYGTWKLPETYLVVRGEVVERWVGDQDWDDPATRKPIEAAIAGVRSGAQAAKVDPGRPARAPGPRNSG